VSDTSQGPGWWLASDGKWYGPEQAPGPVVPSYPPPIAPGTVVTSTMPVGGPGGPPADPGSLPPGGPTYGSPPSGSAGYPPSAPGYGPPTAAPTYGYGYQTGYPPYGYVPMAKTNGLAVASLVCSLLGWLFGLGAVLAIVFGFIARGQIKRSGNAETGNGLALAGIIIGFLWVVLGILVIIAAVAVDHHCHQNGTCTFNTEGSGT
jgi:Domain of unknown function (DUF4190)